jgi:hypothetical protein
MVIRTRSVISHPPGVKPQRPSPEIRHTPANAQLQYTAYNETLIDIHITQNNMQEKLLLFLLKWKMPVCTRVFSSSLWLFSYNHYYYPK